MENTKINQNQSNTISSYYLVLSRVDWRFLLSEQTPKRSLVFADGILADAVKMISESIVANCSGPINNECDLAVAVDPDNKTLKQAWSCLQPGGSIYIEWVLRPFSGIKSVKRKLEEIGFQNVTFFMPQPDPADNPSEIWIPMVQNVVSYYLRGKKYEKKGGNFLNQFKRAICNVLCLFYPIKPITYFWLMNTNLIRYKVCSIASKPIVTGVQKISPSYEGANQKAVTNIPNIVDECLNNLDTDDKSNEVSVLMLTERGGFEKIILFIFIGNDSFPRFVIKFPRTDEPGSSLEKEARVLTNLQNGLQPIKCVPNILYNGYKFGIPIIGETFIHGTTISNIITKINFQDLAMKMTEWLVELAVNTKSQDLQDDYKEQILSSFINSYYSVLTPTLIKQIDDILQGVEPKFRVCTHNDLGLWNVLINTSDGMLGIIDWDAGQMNGFPLTDFIMFFMWMSFQIDEAYKFKQYRTSYRNMLDSSTLTGRVYNQCLQYYTNKLDIPSFDTPAYRLIGLLIQAKHEFPHLVTEKQTLNKTCIGPDKGFYYQLIREELLICS